MFVRPSLISRDFAKAGVKTRLVKPNDGDILAKGRVMEIVTGVTTRRIMFEGKTERTRESRENHNEIIRELGVNNYGI